MAKEKNLELYEQMRQVPESAKRTIKGGRLNGKTDINPMWRVKMLTKQFGPCGLGWYYVPVKKWTESINGETAAFVDIELYVNYNGEWSKPIFGTGGSMFAAKEKSGIYVSDECYKMATTDAISVACKQLGIGADVYWEADKTKYTVQEPEKTVLDTKCVNALYMELSRTGIGIKSMLKTYNKTDIHDLSMAEYNKAMAILKSKPDKPSEQKSIPPENMDEEGLPWKNVGQVKDGM